MSEPQARQIEFHNENSKHIYVFSFQLFILAVTEKVPGE